MKLQKDMDELLETREAQTEGLCPIREEIYSEAFQEIIRQVTLTCKERGTLLSKVRDEFEETKKAYKNLYESAVKFGIRKRSCRAIEMNEAVNDSDSIIKL